MDIIFSNNNILLFFLTVITVFNYSNLEEFQRLSIVYILIYAMTFSNIISLFTSLLFLFMTVFCFLEILTEDSMKFKIIVCPFYKIIDCLYIACAQYGLLYIVLAILILFIPYSGLLFYIFRITSVIFIILGITVTLQQKFVVSSFKSMYEIFNTYPINKVDFNTKLDEACTILISMEDKKYFERKGYTFLSCDYVFKVLKEKLSKANGKRKIHIIFNSGKMFIQNAINEKRGYSTIHMQLIRSIGIEEGYEYKYKRKIFEILYSRMFFEGFEKMLESNQVSKRENIKKYYLYIYFHKVNTFLGDAQFSKFLNAFDMKYNEENEKDIYNCSNEGIFIACMGLSKRTDKITEENLDTYLQNIENIQFDRNKILNMVSNMMDKPYDGNYLE